MVVSHEAYEKSVTAFKNSITGIREQIMALKLENSKHEWNLVQANEEISVLRNENEKLHTSVQSHLITITNLKEENNASRLKLQEFDNAFMKKSEECLQLADEMKDMKHHEATKRQQIESYEYELKHIEQNLYVALQDGKSLQETCDFYKTELEKKCKEYQEVMKDQKTQETKTSEMMDSLHAQRSALEKDLNESLETITTCKDTITKQSGEINTTNAKYEQCQRELRKYKSLCQRTKDLNNIQEENNKKLSSKVRHLLSDGEELMKTNQTLTEDLKCARGQNDSLMAELQQKADMESALNKSIDELEYKKENSLLQIRQLEEMEQSRLSGYEKSAAQYETIVQKLRSDVGNTRLELKEQRKEMSALKQDNLAKDFRIQELSRRLREKEVTLMTPSDLKDSVDVVNCSSY